MSVTEITTAAGWIAGLAIVAMLAAGWRKPARAGADPSRALRPSRAPVGAPVEARPAPLYRPAPWWKRLFALVASGGMAIVLGAVIATVVGFGAAWGVITLSDLLKK